METIQQQRKIQHLFWRAGFGASPAKIQQAVVQPFEQIVRQLFKDSKEVEKLSVVGQREPQTALKMLKKEVKSTAMSKEEIREQLKEAIKEGRETIGNLNDAWVERMGTGSGALREKMTLFWHNHFACRSRIATFVEQQNNILRHHALGKFGDLLMAISKDAAMLQFLNNQQNRKKSPNENFAREVMELFTLGRGNYTEQDIKEAARAFTGWGFNPKGEFVFRELFHDEGMKTVFGQSGHFTGEDVIEMLLKHPQTAKHISAKIYRYFVNEKPNEKHIEEMANRFRKTNYDIADLMHHVFSSSWFYDSSHIGAQIKSPVELLAGFQQALTLDFQDKTPVLYVQKILGQVLFFPPNVAGWTGGKAWMDSTSLLSRMQLPNILFRNETLQASVKDNGDANEEKIVRRTRFDLKMDWEGFAKQFEQLPENTLCQTLASYLIQVPVNEVMLKAIGQRISVQNRTERIKQMTISLMSLPEYQVC